jgi:hypothetical protein
MKETVDLTAESMQAALEEADALHEEGWTVEEWEPGLLRWPGRPERRVSFLVWMAVRAMVIGVGSAAQRRRT